MTLNGVIRDEEWAKISLDSWKHNLAYDWQWDNNKFVNNQFAHPYHGALYFNSARSNGYSFWESTPFVLAGSLAWELFSEVWAPAPNDLINTTLGGINLGEMMHRLSSLTLDNRARGSERTFREIGAALIDPVRGFNRLVRGQTNDHGANPPDWRPGTIQANMDLGWRHSSGFSTREGEGQRDQASLNFNLYYGDQVEDVQRSPFSAFRVRGELVSNNGEDSALTTLNARGNLGGWALGEGSGSHHTLGIQSAYEYTNAPGFEWGGQGFGIGLYSRWGDRDGFRAHTEVLLTPMVLTALRSDYYVDQFVTTEGRDYDYGPSIGAYLEAGLIWPGRALLRGSYRVNWQDTVSGTDSTHTQQVLLFEGRVYLSKKFGIGAAWTGYWRNSNYEDFEDVDLNGNQARVFLSIALPRWTDQ